MKSIVGFSALIVALAAGALAQDSGWPRQWNKDGATALTYQPQVDAWENFTDLDWRQAFAITPPGGKQVVGALEAHAHTAVDPENDNVTFDNITIKHISFPGLDPAAAAQMEQLARAFVPPTVTMSMRRLVACVPKKDAPAQTVQLKNDPPAIFVSYTPAILLYIDGQPQYAKVQNTDLMYVVNTSWPVFMDGNRTTYYLLAGQQWLTASGLQGPWMPTKKLHKDMDKLPNDPHFASLKAYIPPPASSSGPTPNVFMSLAPAEVLLFDGPPVFAKIPGTQLTYVSNTQSNAFLHTPTMTYYYLTSGRWFRAGTLQGPWTFATPNLPPDFAQIPPASPAGRVRESVPGTEEAKDAVLIAQVPTVMTVNAQAAAAEATVSYDGDPKFAPIEGTTLSYATNTQNKVIQVGNTYYLCEQGIWFMSLTAAGPWTTATSVPQVIYTIPPSSPVYNVTYVNQTVVNDSVQSSYTAGYLGAFVMGAAVGAVIAGGTGYYYPPYVGVGVVGGYGAYYPAAATYGAPYTTNHGAYGVSQTAYGANGSTATRSAQYNPYTGTYSRGASASGPNGSANAERAYNPYTGASAAHAGGSTPSESWGSSAVSKNGQTATAQHTTTAAGTTGSFQSTTGAKGAATSNANGTTAAGKSANGDMYASHDGNVYKNTGSGWEKSNGNGSWSNVSKPSSTSSSGGASSASHSSSAPEGMNEEAQNRQRGEQSASRYQQSRSGGFGGGGGRRR
jgi:hypothetical protein